MEVAARKSQTFCHNGRRRSTSPNPGEYVYDPFAGSGTLMVACEKTNRRALMMELDPKFVEVILQRFQKYTGKDAIRDDGTLYKDLRD